MLMSWRHVSKSSSQKQYGCGVSPIINRLSRIYDNVTMYEERDMSGLYKTACFYYAGMSSMQEITDQEVYVGRCETGEIRKPFWVVCRNYASFRRI